MRPLRNNTRCLDIAGKQARGVKHKRKGWRKGVYFYLALDKLRGLLALTRAAFSKLLPIQEPSRV